jgi:hypothetical protein
MTKSKILLLLSVCIFASACSSNASPPPDKLTPPTKTGIEFCQNLDKLISASEIKPEKKGSSEEEFPTELQKQADEVIKAVDELLPVAPNESVRQALIRVKTAFGSLSKTDEQSLSSATVASDKKEIEAGVAILGRYNKEVCQLVPEEMKKGSNGADGN